MTWVGEYYVGWTQIRIASAGIHVCSRCGARGTYGEMVSHVNHQHGYLSPVEEAEIGRKELFERVRRGE